MSRCRDERGTVVVELTWLSILLLVPLLYVVLAVFETQRGAFATIAASRAAGRAFALSPDEVTARARAQTAADLALGDQGLPPERALVRATCRPACLQPGSVVEVTVVSWVALPLLPSVFGADTPRIRVSSTQRVPYGTYREAR